MKRMRFINPLDYKKSSITGITREHWLEAFYQLVKGIIDNASPNCARQLIPGQRSHHGLLADELEGFTRSFIMVGPWLATRDRGYFEYMGEKVDVVDFYRRGILAGTDPSNPEYWGEITDYAQHLVEMASLAWSLFLSKKHIWDSFSEKEKKQVADYLFSCTRVKYHRNNWLLFNVVTNAVLKKLGMPYSQKQIDENIGVCDSMYIGNGWYRDGDVNRIDYYNAWAFHYYYLIWVFLDGDSKPELAKVHIDRINKFFNNFLYFIDGEGAVPVFGRSMIYRFGYLAPFALALKMNALNVPKGLVKTVFNSTFKFFFSREILTDDNFLSMGFIHPCEDMLEHYSCGGSPYWAVKAFNILLLPEDDSFWSAGEEKLPIQSKDFKHPINEAGFILVGDKKSGHVQLINQKSHHDNPDYNAKYTKFAYSSVFSYEARKIYGNYNCDNVLQFSDDGVRYRQRWKMETLYVTDSFSASTYPIYEVDEDGSITSYIILKDDFMINIHLVEATKPLFFREGGYPLGYNSGEPTIVSGDDYEAAFIDNRISFIRTLYGYNRKFKAAPFAGDIAGSNVRYRFSVVPVVAYIPHERYVAAKETGPSIFASMVCGRVGYDLPEQINRLLRDFSVRGKNIFIRFYDGEEVFLQVGDVEQIDTTLNGNSVTGRVVMARYPLTGDGEIIFAP